MTETLIATTGETPDDHRPLTDVLFENFDLHPLLLHDRFNHQRLQLRQQRLRCSMGRWRCLWRRR
jgi:hypothetical protein